MEGGEEEKRGEEKRRREEERTALERRDWGSEGASRCTRYCEVAVAVVADEGREGREGRGRGRGLEKDEKDEENEEKDDYEEENDEDEDDNDYDDDDEEKDEQDDEEDSKEGEDGGGEGSSCGGIERRPSAPTRTAPRRPAAPEGYATRGDQGHLMLWERIVPQSEVIRAIFVEDSLCCGFPRLVHRRDVVLLHQALPLLKQTRDAPRGWPEQEHMKVRQPQDMRHRRTGAHERSSNHRTHWRSWVFFFTSRSRVFLCAASRAVLSRRCFSMSSLGTGPDNPR